METLEIICLIYAAGFVLNSLLSLYFIEKMRKEEPEKFINPILVMVCVFLSWGTWLYVGLHMAAKWLISQFRHD